LSGPQIVPFRHVKEFSATAFWLPWEQLLQLFPFIVSFGFFNFCCLVVDGICPKEHTGRKVGWWYRFIISSFLRIRFAGNTIFSC